MKKMMMGLSLLAAAAQVQAGWLDSASGMLDSASKITGTAAAVTSQPATAASTAAAVSAESTLLPMLTSSLGVTETQAAGGMGSLLQLAQGALGATDYGTLSGYIPNSDSLLAAVPQTTTGSAAGLAGNLLGSSGGGLTGKLVGAAQVASQFKALGLDAAMIPQYIEVTNQYLQTQGGQEAVALFAKGVAGAL